MQVKEKAAVFRARSYRLRVFANRGGSSRLRDDLLRAALEWEMMAQRIEQECGLSKQPGGADKRSGGHSD